MAKKKSKQGDSIPRRLFFFWGNEKMSWLRYMTLYSARKMNPEWNIQLYYSPSPQIIVKPWETDEQQDYFLHSGSETFLQAIRDLDIEIIPWELTHPGHPEETHWREVGANFKSDFFKYFMLGTGGGFYADMDILFIKPMEVLYPSMTGYDTVICYGKPYVNYMSVGLLGSMSNNPLFYDLFIEAFNTYTPKRYQSAGLENIYHLLMKVDGAVPAEGIDWDWVGSTDLMPLIHKKYPGIKVFNLPLDVIYPWKHNETDWLFTKTYPEGLRVLTQRTIGIHWYAGDKTSQRHNNLLTAANYRQHNSLVTYLAAQVEELPLLSKNSKRQPAVLGDTQLLLENGNAFLAQSDFERAYREGERVTALRPGDPLVHVFMGLVQLAQGKPDEAAGTFQQAVHLFPADSIAQNLLASISGQTNRAVTPPAGPKNPQPKSEGGAGARPQTPIKAAVVLQMLLDNEDLPTALQIHREKLDATLFVLVRANAAAARMDGNFYLAEGLETLADYIQKTIC